MSPKKLFVVLNDPEKTETPYLVLKTTSQPHRYQNVHKGCNHDKKVFFLEAGASDLFDGEMLREPTYIQLPGITEFSIATLLQDKIKDRVKILEKVKLSSLCIAQLKNCLKHFKKDISPKNYALVFSA
jgi:hypothetical protein